LADHPVGGGRDAEFACERGAGFGADPDLVDLRPRHRVVPVAFTGTAPPRLRGELGPLGTSDKPKVPQPDTTSDPTKVGDNMAGGNWTVATGPDEPGDLILNAVVQDERVAGAGTRTRPQPTLAGGHGPQANAPAKVSIHPRLQLGAARRGAQ